MEDLRIKQQQKENIKIYKNYINKKWWIVLVFIIVLLIIIFPSESGKIIGQWIHDFVGNLIKYSKF